jgi:hypothetical protein
MPARISNGSTSSPQAAKFAEAWHSAPVAGGQHGHRKQREGRGIRAKVFGDVNRSFLVNMIV